MYMLVIGIHAAIFCSALHSFRSPYRDMVGYHLENIRMQLHDAVEVNCERAEMLNID